MRRPLLLLLVLLGLAISLPCFTMPPIVRAAPAQPVAPAQSNDPQPPVWMYIGSIGLSAPVVSVGTDANGYPIVPDHDIGWFNQSAMPGTGENVVFWGHVLRFRAAPHIPAPFERLREARIGDPIFVYDAAGREFVYYISEQVWVTPDQVQYILPVGYERLTLVSCIGAYIIEDGSVQDMSHRLITIATP